MQKLILFFILCFLINIAKAQTEVAVSNPTATNAKANSTAKVVLYRPYAVGSWLYSPKLVFGERKIRIKNRHLIEFEIPIGTYEVKNKAFTIGTRKIGFNLQAEADKIYYIRYRILGDVFIAIDEFIQVDENFARQEIAKGKFRTQKQK